MITVEHLTKCYGDFLAVDDLSFEIDEGHVYGFLGPNGAGKSTTMNIMTGCLSATGGRVRVDGYDVFETPKEAKKRIGYLPEIPPLYTDMTVKEYLNFMYDLKKVKLPRKEHIAEICSLVKIDDVYGRLIANLSKGYRQRVGIAQALLGNPPVLILDEPTVGLDPKQIIEIRNLIKSLGRKHTVILSSHILSEVQAVCERVIVINRGSIVADGTPDSLAHSLSNENRLLLRMEGEEKAIKQGLHSLRGVKEVDAYGEKEPGVYEFSVEGNEGTDLRRPVFALAAQNHWPILSMKNTDLTLEDVFLRLTSDLYDHQETAQPSEILDGKEGA